MGVKALGAFSGGLDGMVAASILCEQGIDVELATFDSPFFSSEQGRISAEILKLPWRKIDYTEKIISLLKYAPSGYGKNCNPCIDCHTGMFQMLGRIAEEEKFDVIFTGEVVGQRPMSQNIHSLRRVARLSGYKDILLRPLSAKILKPTLPELDGRIDREQLLDINGRSRKRQIALAAKYGIKEYPNPAGGCVLTDENYCRRLKTLMTIPELFTVENCRLIRHGRFFELAKDTIGLVGRDHTDNMELVKLVGENMIIELDDNIPGPTCVLLGNPKYRGDLFALLRRYRRGQTPREGCPLE
ncbi:MAG: tRNA 4-thiouridine(8) synthase ThiI [FCB group bacterium]|nr:tRNA 4-thiouridine(8) synthase ThiI [FCB group bacterium]